MKKVLALLIFLCCADTSHGAEYVGYGVCAKCHLKEYNEYVVSQHPYILTKATDPNRHPVPLPEGYAWDDISYVIGGTSKVARYVDKQGYVLTAGKDGSKIKNQYNVESGTWSYFFSLEKKSYKCAKCHTTGYNKNGHQGDMKGVVGTWVFSGVQCEACHGPAGDHVQSNEAAKKYKLKIDKTSAFCGRCHLRGEAKTIMAKSGFIRSREQYSEHLNSPHSKLGCVECHNQHTKPSLSGGIKQKCESCHNKQALRYKENIHFEVGVRCIECHMPRAGKAALTTSKFQGDVRTHLVKINIDPDSTMFTDDGKYATCKFVTLDFACLNCHRDKDKKWAAANATGVHAINKVTVKQ